MSDTERKILEQFEEVLPKLNETQKARLLGMSEGLSLAIEKERKTT